MSTNRQCGGAAPATKRSASQSGVHSACSSRSLFCTRAGDGWVSLLRGALFNPTPGFSPERDRVMLCGSMAMIKETGELLESYGMKEGSNAEPGDYVLERAFVG